VIPGLPWKAETSTLPRALFGYKRSAVDALVDEVREYVHALALELEDRAQRIAELELESSENRDDQLLISETLLAARKEAMTIQKDARQSADEVIQSARREATEIVEKADRKARAKAKELLESAQREREAIVDAAQQERGAVLAEARDARTFVEETHEQLSDFLMAAVKWYEQAKPVLKPELEAAGKELEPPDDELEPPDDDELELSPDEPEPLAAQEAEEPSSPSNDRSSIPSTRTASPTRGSQRASNSRGRSTA
jgi:cell division septum initiation protein DivIVA